MPISRDMWLVLGLVIIALAVVAGVIAARRSRRRGEVLRERFGPEYARTIKQFGGKRGERMLSERLERAAQIDVRELSDAERERFGGLWTQIQAQFVDDPRAAVGRASDLIKEVMRARGYSADEGFDQRAADLSVDHPEVVEHYRVARELCRGRADQSLSTEQLRQAVVHYRVLFADLLEAPRQPAMPAPLRPAPT